MAIWKYETVSTNSSSGQIWSSAYRGVQFSNIILARVPAIQMDENLMKQFLGEAHYLRALHYFNLVRFYGGVPLVTNEMTTLAGVEMPKSSSDEVYGLIEADLKAAESSLPRNYSSNANIGRATLGAAKGLPAKVYLARAGNVAGSPYWAQAAAKAKEVIDLKIYDLWDDYADVFAIRNRGGKESLFEVMFLTDIQGNSFTTGYASRGAPIVPNNGYGIFRVNKSLFEPYTPADKRTAITS